MVVQHNMQAANANRMLNITSGAQSKSTEKLSSGYRINRAADDAAGLSISEKMRKQIRGLDKASSNAQDGVSSVQTAEGALTEVHSMLQRMNELATQAANGTNSTTDRSAIQDEISQLTTEIDRVAETTKFNETYLLKGDKGTKEVYMKGHDAGLNGSLTDNATSATFKVAAGALDAGKSVTIGGKDYTIGATVAEAKKIADDKKTTNGAKVTVNGVEYTSDGTNLKDAKNNVLDTSNIKAGDIVSDGTKTLTASDIDTATGVDKSNSSVISAAQAVKLMTTELTAANNIGTTKNAATVTAGTYASDTGVEFTINKGTAEVAEKLSFSLHVGSDADMTNKITVGIETMNSSYLGIKGLNVNDDSGIAATYAVDAISDALQKVSDQRSSLGAVQNRLEHTIDNLDNVVENTTSAESRIRDTDMAKEMVNYSKNNILAQAGQSMLAQANQSNQGVLSLLQ
ncbi:flagellar hook protein [Agathobacter rectalis]|uniref:Flagellin n=1 Tax=Agathobacter rectalis TaxID=39491 RepID=A0A414I1A4_9FIRM|nr:flagellin [Agathobacter rectalis]RHD97497.1 flagellar hook protein [Agathobacter rectalis]